MSASADRRADLAAFLRARRARVSPQDAGLPAIGPRRTPGLRSATEKAFLQLAAQPAEPPPPGALIRQL
jgi:hypothetical protein